MKILLLRPASSELYHTLGPDLGLGYLATNLRNKNYKVKIIDCLRQRVNLKNLAKIIGEEKPQIVGIKTYSRDLNWIKQAVPLIKEIDKQIVLILGGPHPSGDPEHTLEFFENVDFAFGGEAERELPLLIMALNDKKKWQDLPGLIYREDNQIKINPPLFIDNLDSLGFPAWDLMNPREYPLDYRGCIYIPIITTRGCPYSCTYCAGKNITGKKLRMRSAENIIEELKMLKYDYNISHFSIVDDNFTLNRNFAYTVCKVIIENNLNMRWNCPNGVRLDTLDEELLQIMEKAGCYSIDVAIESGSPRILEKMRRQMDIETIYEKISLIKEKTNMLVMGYFIIGFPGEEKIDREATIKLALKLPLDRAGFFLFSPHPGTEIYYKLKTQGKITNFDWHTISYNRVSIISDDEDLRELKKIYRKAFVKFYFRPKIILNFFQNFKSIRQILATLKRVFNVWLMR